MRRTARRTATVHGDRVSFRDSGLTGPDARGDDEPRAFAARLLDVFERRPPAVWDLEHLARRIAEHTRFDE